MECGVCFNVTNYFFLQVLSQVLCFVVVVVVLFFLCFVFYSKMNVARTRVLAKPVHGD